jgi:isopentenyl-diphosphate delta-isomerase
MHRAKNESEARLAAAFVNWGIPTAQSILNVKESAPAVAIFASGGLRDGLDIAKCIALGATLGGMASPFLKAAVRSIEDTIQAINEIHRQIQVCMFAAGAGDLENLRKAELSVN